MARPAWRGPRVAPGASLALLELVASEDPDLLEFAIDTLQSSPARPDLLKLMKLFEVEHARQLKEPLRRLASVLDRLLVKAGRGRIGEVGDTDGSPVMVLQAFGQARFGRAWRQERWTAEMARIQRLLEREVGLERAANLVREFAGRGVEPEPTGVGKAIVEKYLR